MAGAYSKILIKEIVEILGTQETSILPGKGNHYSSKII